MAISYRPARADSTATALKFTNVTRLCSFWDANRGVANFANFVTFEALAGKTDAGSAGGRVDRIGICRLCHSRRAVGQPFVRCAKCRLSTHCGALAQRETMLPRGEP